MLVPECKYFVERAEGIITRGVLLSVKRKALRAGVYFRAISRLERALLECAIRVVKIVWSDTLAKLLMRIILKLLQAAGQIPLALAEYMGAKMARQTAKIAQKWGYKEAKSWEYDINFMRYQALNYLAIRNILDPIAFKSWLEKL